MDIQQIRKRNLEEVIKNKFNASNAALSRFMEVNPAQINRIFYVESKGGRKLGDQFARQIEKKVGLDNGWLDIPHWLTKRPQNEPNSHTDTNLVNNLRLAVPYFNSLAHKTIVIYIDSDVIDDESALFSIIQDIALLDSIGVKIVLVHGSRIQIDRQLAILGLTPKYVNDIRITDSKSLNAFKLAIGETRVRIEGLLSLGLANSPLDGARLSVVSGNAVVGQPIGVKNGTDFEYSGIIRSIKTDFIDKWLQTKSVVLLSPIAYSPTGDMYNVHSLDVATACASALKADKLIILSKHEVPIDDKNERISTINSNHGHNIFKGTNKPIRKFIDACISTNKSGVKRCHIINARIDGALITELFTPDGVGTMISNEPAQIIRSANVNDIPGIIALIRPLEQQGALVPRSQQLIENHIEEYFITESESQVIACAALHPYHEENIAEIACVAVTATHQGEGIASELLKKLESQAKRLGLEKIFVLTTETSQWFQRHHYHLSSIDELPIEKRKSYDTNRKSRIYIKDL